MSGSELESLAAHHRDLAVEVVASSAAETVLRVPGRHARELLSRLRDTTEGSPARLVDLAAIDRGAGPDRFEVVYRLRPAGALAALRVHAVVAEDSDSGVPVIDSMTGLWPVASWLEREAFDLFGIRFRGHPDLRRLLLDPGFVGAPLRKDHPLRTEGAGSAEERA